MYNCFKCTYSDDYRSGPELHLREINDFSNDSDSDDETCEIEIPFTNEYQVYFLALGVGDVVLNKIGPMFHSKDDVELFAKKQYYLRTGGFPFISSGVNGAYHHKGKRTPFDVDDEEVSLIDFEHDDMYREFLLISNGNFIESHSLNSFAIW